MRNAIICTAAVLLGFVSGSFVAKPFFNPHVTATPVAVTETPITPSCGVAGQPGCAEETPTTPAPATSTPPEPIPPIEVNFDAPSTYTIDDTVTYPDGLMVTLTAINDSRCQPDVQCIWAGELSPQLSFTYGDLKETVTQLSLGTSRTESQTIGAYNVSLIAATENSATIIITKDTPATPVTKAPAVTQAVAGAEVTKKPVSPIVSALAPVPPPTSAVTNSAFGAEVAALITAATKKLRQDESLPAYRADSDLAASAKKYSGRLLAGNYLAHIDTSGCDLTCRFDESGYLANSWGENLAMMEYNERPSAEYVANFFMTQWQKSAGHRKNLLSPTYTHQGVGVSVESGKLYVVVHFALPS